MKKICDCKDWEIYAPKLDGTITIAWIHNEWLDKFKPFKYCPWCGKELKE